MFSQLPPRRATAGKSVSVLALVIRVFTRIMVSRMELLGAVRAFEIMALTGNAGQRNGNQKQGKKFHRALHIHSP